MPEAERKEARYATCVDKEPAAAPAPKPADKPAAKPAAKAQWVTKTDMDVEKRDIPCNGKAFCQVSTAVPVGVLAKSSRDFPVRNKE